MHILDSCLDSRALFRAVNQESLLASLAATLTNKFQSGLSGSAVSTRQRIWATLLHFQKSRGQLLTEENTRAPRASFSPLHQMYRMATSPMDAAAIASADIWTNSILPLLVNELFEYVPGDDAGTTTLLLRSMMLLVDSGAVVPGHDATLDRSLNHLAAHFPLARIDAGSSSRQDFKEANMRTAALLLASPVTAWQDIVLSFAVAKVSDPQLGDDLRRILLQDGCNRLWSSPECSFKEDSAGGRLAEAFCVYFNMRLSSTMRELCVPSLVLLLAQKVPIEAIVKPLLRACAKTLWQPGTAAKEGILNALWSFVRRFPGDSAQELLNVLMVPMYSVELSDGRLRMGIFRDLNVSAQLAAVRLFAGLDSIASDGLRAAWTRALTDVGTSDRAAQTLLTIVHDRRQKLFASTSDYLSWMGRLLFREPCSVPVAASVALCICNVLPEWPESVEMVGNVSEFGLLAFEDTLPTLLQDRQTAAKALMLVLAGSSVDSQTVLRRLPMTQALFSLIEAKDALAPSLVKMLVPLIEEAIVGAAVQMIHVNRTDGLLESFVECPLNRESVTKILVALQTAQKSNNVMVLLDSLKRRE